MNKLLLSIFIVLLFCGLAIAQDSKPLKILAQPKPELPKNFGTLDAQGTIVLRVVFLANGQIGDIAPVLTMPFGLTENAIEAAKKIEFEPMIKNGKTITVAKTIQYFYKYGEGWSIPSQQTAKKNNDEKAEAVIKKAVETLGGERYLQVKTQIGRGKFSILREGVLLSFQTFVDVIVFPDSERTEFKFSGVKNIQTNSNGAGWIFDGSAQVLNDQTAEQVEGFQRGLRASLDNLLRGYWRGKAELSYVGRREAGIGKRNEVVKLTYDDGFSVEFEFGATDFMPVKAIYKRLNPDNEEIKEEDRYAQFVETQGIKSPYIIDHFTNGLQTSRINYESIEFNKTVSDKIFAKPKDAKEAKKDLKL